MNKFLIRNLGKLVVSLPILTNTTKETPTDTSKVEESQINRRSLRKQYSDGKILNEKDTNHKVYIDHIKFFLECFRFVKISEN